MKETIYLEFCYASSVVVADKCYLKNPDSLTVWDQCSFRDNVYALFLYYIS